MLSLEDIRLTGTYEGRAFVVASLDFARGQGLSEGVILAIVKQHLLAEIDVAAERARAPWITPGIGQAMEYDRVAQQADAALKAPSKANAATYPMLAATVGIDIDPETGEVATDILGVARSVQVARDAWTGPGAEIRKTRMAVKAAISRAASIERAIEMANSASWPAAASP